MIWAVRISFSLRDQVGRDVLRRHVDRPLRGDLHAEVLEELLEIRALRGEIGLAVQLDEDADLAVGVDVVADAAFARWRGRCAVRPT